MKKFYTIFSLLSILFSVVLTSCEDEDDSLQTGLTQLKTVNFAGIPQVSTQNRVLTQEMQDAPAINISWNAVNFPVAEAPVAYNLQFDVPADTLGESAWANAQTIPVGNEVLSKEMSVKELNTLAKDFGLEAGLANTLAYRVRAYVDRPVFSQAGTFTVTPYDEVVGGELLYIPGAYQGWDPATAATIFSTATSGVFEGFLSFTDPASLGFKFTTAPNWDENYGSDGNGNLVFDGENASVPEVGTYKITVNLNDLTWQATPSSWGIIGTATPSGWDADTDMTYNYIENYWEYTGSLVPGALKFRLNDAWDVNYGSQNSTDFTAYLDDPGAHDVTEAGDYHVTFQIDNEDPSLAYYTIELL